MKKIIQITVKVNDSEDCEYAHGVKGLVESQLALQA